MSFLDVPDEVLLQVLQFLDVKEVCRVQRSSLYVLSVILKHYSMLKKLAYPIVLNVSTPSLRVAIANRQIAWESRPRFVVSMSSDRSRIFLSITSSVNRRSEKCHVLRPTDFPNDEMIFKTFLTSALRHIHVHRIDVDAVNANMLAFLVDLVGPRVIYDGVLTIGFFSPMRAPGMNVQKIHEDCLLNESLRKFTFSRLVFQTFRSYEISRATVDHWISTCNYLTVTAPKSTLDVNDEVLDDANFLRYQFDVVTMISAHGFRRLLSNIDEGATFIPSEPLGFLVKSTQPLREFFDTIIQGLSGSSAVFDGETFCNAEFTMKHVVFSMNWDQEFRREEIEPGSFLYSVFMRRNWDLS